MKRILLVTIFLCMGGLAQAQPAPVSPQTQPDSAPEAKATPETPGAAAPASNLTPGENPAAAPSANASDPSQPRPRRRPRVIINREFDDRDKIMLLLNAHCDYPSKEDLLSTSPDAEKYLREILNDETVLFSVRMRTIEALAYFNNPQNLETVEEILRNPDDHEPLMLMQAIRAYPKMAPERAPAALAPFLAKGSDITRFVTITSLKNCPGNAALSVLQERYEVEKNRFFQARLKQAIDNHCKQDTYCQ
ncbi:MAG: HEAT repeat domain-containing protein [Proteobacteria bacterium]|nr:HEAT repeat domain-containing protein [Pseudomonadota bacterium]